jgi:hypothetical protein
MEIFLLTITLIVSIITLIFLIVQGLAVVRLIEMSNSIAELIEKRRRRRPVERPFEEES